MHFNTCSVFGHWDINEEDTNLETKLINVFVDLIENKQVVNFYFGGFGNFDELCHKVVTNLQKKYTHIKRFYVCDDYKFIYKPHKRPKWLKDEDYEEFIYFDTRYTGFYKRVYFRNCEMINNSDYLIFYIRKTEQSGAYKTFLYARKKKKNIIQV